MTSRGRPPRAPTAEERARVKEFVDEGASQRIISIALGRSIPSLRKYFAVELGIENKSAPEAPPVKITAAMRDDVALMAACNEPPERIAKAVGVSVDDLGKFFAEDLDIGASRYRLKTLRRLDTLAASLNLGAAKQMAAMTTLQPAAAPAGATAAPGTIGKKAAAQADAEEAVSAGGKFAPRAAPRLVVSGGKKVP